MKRKSKGVTPVVATVLLITISVAATASAYTFITNAQKQTAQNFEERLSRQERRSKSNMNIEYVYNSTENFTLMNVRNTGSISIKILDDDGNKILRLYSQGGPVGNQGKGWKFVGASRNVLDPSELVTINTTVTFPVNGQSKSFTLTGEYKNLRDSHICYNSGSQSC